MGINKDQVQGRVEQATGKVREVVGNATGNKGMEVAGNVQKNVGKAQTAVGDAKENIAKTIRKP